jgi:hypothetical protein
VELLERLERYYDQVPRSAARVETIGPFTLFVQREGAFPYYARPKLGATAFTAFDVERVRERQLELGVPESFEWVEETTPWLSAVIDSCGLAVHRHPLQVVDEPLAVEAVEDFTARLVSADEPALWRISAVARVAFGAPGTAIGEEGVEALDAARSNAAEVLRERLQRGLTVTAAAFTAWGEPVAVGSHQPLGGVSEIVGVGTLPAFRRRGLAAWLTALLARDALGRAETVFLSAGDEDVARMYARVGFRRVATACIAEP